MVRYFKKTVFLLFGAVALVSLSPSSAKAQHIVTETEAGKLTLESLTAAPVVRHHRIHNVAYRTSAKRNHSNKLVRNVSYKSKGKFSVKNAVYNSSTHKRVVKRRHRS